MPRHYSANAGFLLNSEFPSLSNSSQLPGGNPSSMWSTGNTGARNFNGPIQRNQNASVSQQAGQDDLFTQASSRIPPAQGSFRFGNQGNMQQSTQIPPSSIDDFPPLSRGASEDIGSERAQSLMSTLGFGPQGVSNGVQGQSNRGNGLLNALSANSRTSEARSPLGETSPIKLICDNT